MPGQRAGKGSRAVEMVDHGSDMTPNRRYRRALAAASLLLVLLGLTVLTAPGRAAAQQSPAVAQARDPAVIDFIQVDGVIDPPVSAYLLRRLSEASTNGADLAVVQLNTRGGLDAPVQEIVEAMLASKVPVATWVSPSGARAAGAGTFIALAGNVVAMAPGTTLGPASPLNLAARPATGGAGRAAGDATALLQPIAAARGRSVDWAGRSFADGSTLTADQAVKQGVADIVAGSPSTLLQKLDGRTVEAGGRQVTLSTATYQLRFHKLSVMERLLHTALRPEIAYFLLLFGLFGLIFEIYNPGVGAAGVTGGICLAFAFYAFTVLPTSWGGVALLIVAVALLIIEMHEAGLGIFTVGGLAAFVAGSVMLFRGADPALRLPWIAIAAAVACLLLFFISVMTAAIRSRASVPVSGTESMAGMIGEARSDIAPDGQVFAKGTLWKARTAGMAIAEGAKVRILGVSGLMLIVEQAEAPAETHTPD